MFRYAHKFFKLEGAERSLFVKAYLLGIAYAFYVFFVPQRVIFKRLGQKSVESSFKLSNEQSIIVNILEKSMHRVARFLPLRIKCFARALTARRMLKKKDIPSTIYFGVAKEGQNKLIAHAWLRSGDTIVTGKEEMGRFTPILFFT